MDQNLNGIFQLSVAYMGPLATLSCHLEGLTPLTPVATHRVGSKLPKIMKKKVMLPPNQKQRTIKNIYLSLN